MSPQTRRFPPLYPGDVRRCPNGCPERAPVDKGPPIMPDWAPDNGAWYSVCLYCGWVVRYLARHGDRAQDICWIVDENVTPEQATIMRAWGLEERLKQGMGPWPD